MNKTPKRKAIPEDTKKAIINKNKYSDIHVFDPDFLEEYKVAILRDIPDPELQIELRENMDKIQYFVIGDRVNNGLSRLCCSSTEIHMDTQYADITPDSFALKEDCSYIQTIFVHELLHAAARQTGNKRNLTGILEFITDENGKAIPSPNNRKYIGLNEGITQYFAERIMAPVPNDIDGYTFNKQVAKLLAEILGEEVLRSSYFEHTGLLKDTLNSLAQDENYFEQFNRQLDTVNRLETTIRRIESGKIKVENPGETIARMREVSKAQQATMMEGLFSKVIIPSIQKIEIPPVLDVTKPEQVEAQNNALKQRQARLLAILGDNQELLRVVAKYVPLHSNSDFISDEILTEIQKEIQENGMSFDKIAHVVKTSNDRYIIGGKVAKDFLGAVDAFYQENQDALKDRSTTLTPFLKRRLESMVARLDEFEAAATNPDLQESVRRTREEFLRKHFHMIPNLDEEIEKIRQERKKDFPTIDPVEAARKTGAKAGQNGAYARPAEDEKGPEQKEPAAVKKATLFDRFVIDSHTAAVIDQRKLSIYDKAVNIAFATNEIVTVEDDVIVETRAKAVEKYRASLPDVAPGNLAQLYGDRWREVLVQAFEEGYNIGMQQELAKAAQQGKKEKGKVVSQIDAGKYQPSTKPVDFEELRFISNRFEVQQTEAGEVVVDKETKKPVLDKRTKQAAIFATEWKKINGDQAFTPEAEEVYRFVQLEMYKENVDIPEIQADAEAMGENFQKVVETLIVSEETRKKVTGFFEIPKPKKEASVHVDTLSGPTKKEENEYSELPLEEVIEKLSGYSATPQPGKKGEPPKPVFNDPVVGAKLNARYRELKGEDHPFFVDQTPIIIERLRETKEELIKAGAYTPEYFDKVEAIKKDLETRHPELASESKEKSGSK